MRIAPGEVIAGKYRIDRLLGSGGMGMVLAATHLHLQERVAIKLMHPESLSQTEAVSRFMREARAAVKLKSEHVARVLDVGLFGTEGAPYMVMEYLEGLDLAALLKTRGVLGVEEAADYVLQACDAIAEAHSLGIIHRDLKPANLFVTRRPDGTPFVKVLDFGISKANALLEPGALRTKTATMMGSPLYMSPEQMRSAKDVDARSDIWSLGILLYELVTGRVPFHANGLGALLTLVRTVEPAPVRALNASVPPTFEAVILRCLAKEQAARFGSVAELARALAPYAPVRSRFLVDRIAGVLGASVHVAAHAGVSPLAATAYDPTGSSRPPGPLPQSRTSSRPPATGSPWASSQARTVNRSVAGPVAVLAVWLVLGIAGTFGYFAYRRAQSATAAAPHASAMDLPTAASFPPPRADAGPSAPP